MLAIDYEIPVDENEPPTTPGVSITPTDPMTLTDVTTTVTTPSTDADGDPITYTYEWYVNNVLVFTGSQFSLYNRNEDGTYLSPPGDSSTLTKLGDQIEVREASGMRTVL